MMIAVKSYPVRAPLLLEDERQTPICFIATARLPKHGVLQIEDGLASSRLARSVEHLAAQTAVLDYGSLRKEFQGPLFITLDSLYRRCTSNPILLIHHPFNVNEANMTNKCIERGEPRRQNLLNETPKILSKTVSKSCKYEDELTTTVIQPTTMTT